MTETRWAILIFCFLFPTATDLLFWEVSPLWLIGCTIAAVCANLFCGWELLDICFCLMPGMLLLFLSRLSDGIGMGDVISTFLLGVLCGMRAGLEILFGGSILCFFGQLICMAVRAAGTRNGQKNKKQKKEQKEEQKEEKKEKQKICVAEGEREVQTQSKMPFVPWLLASSFLNWIFQAIL